MSAWASFEYVPNHDDQEEDEINARTAIQAWFVTPTPEQEAMGDIALADFERHVRCERIPNVRENEAVLNLTELHPIKHAFVIFYHTKFEVIHVLGGLTYDALVQCNGIVVIGGLHKHQNRAFFAPYTLSTMAMDTSTDEPKSAHFFWNATFGEAVECVNIEVPLSAFSEKLEWYRACERTMPNDPLPPLVFSDVFADADNELLYAYLDKGTSNLARLLADCMEFCGPHIANTPVDPRKLRARYDAMRYEAEYRLFMLRMQRYKTEDDIISLFDFNGLGPRMDTTDFLVDGTTLDHQYFYAKYRNLVQEEPIVFVNVLVEEIPPAMVSRLPLYPGGRVHLPLVWEPVAEWIWHKYMTQMHLRYAQTRSYVPQGGGGPQWQEWMERERKVMCRYIIAHKPGPQKKQFRGQGGQGGGQVVGKGTGVAIRQADTKGAYIEDIEDFWAIMPPCMAAVRGLKRFPRNLERLRFAQTLWMAGFSEAGIAVPLRDLHDRYRRDGVEQRLENRFNIKSALDSIRKLDKQRATNWCSNIVRDTMMQTPDVLHCPFVQKVRIPEGGSSRDVARLCAPLCCSSMRFSSPQELIEHALKGQLPKVEAEEHVRVFTDSEDEEDEVQVKATSTSGAAS